MLLYLALENIKFLYDDFISGLFEAIGQGKEVSAEFYNNWIEDVKRTVPSDKLLIFSVKEGWEPLCEFLDLPIPEGPFPNTNDTKMMKQRLKAGKIMAYTLVFGVPILIGILIYVLFITLNSYFF